MDPERRWAELVEELGELPGVRPGTMFGNAGLRTGTKFFAMRWADGLVVKRDAATVSAEIAAGRGEPFEPMPGRAMKEWLLLGPDADWGEAARAAHAFLSGRPR